MCIRLPAARLVASPTSATWKNSPLAAKLLAAQPRLAEVAVSWNQVGPQGARGIQGIQGLEGSPGKDGKDGISVTSLAEPAGLNCANGGWALTAANGTTYLCNGAPGNDGAMAGAPVQVFKGYLCGRRFRLQSNPFGCDDLLSCRQACDRRAWRKSISGTLGKSFPNTPTGTLRVGKSSP